MSRPLGRTLMAAAGAAVAAGAIGLSWTALSIGRARWLTERGWARLSAGEVAAAMGAFGKALSDRPGDHDALRGLGESYYLLWRRQPATAAMRERAAKAFSGALEQSPADLDSRVRLLHLEMVADAGAAGPALQRFSLAARISANHPSRKGLQRRFLDLALDAASIPSLRESIFGEEARRAPVVAAASLLASGGEVAVEDIEALTVPPFARREVAAMVSPSAKTLRALVERIIAGKGPGGDVAEWLAELKRGEDNRFHLEVARQLAAAKQGPRALEALEAWLVGHAADAAVHFAAAAAAYGPSEEAWVLSEGHYQRALRLAPLDGAFRRGYAEKLVWRRLWERALEELDIVLRLRPRDARARYLKGLALEGVGRWEEAAAELRRAVELAPGNAVFRSTLDRVRGGG